MAIIDFYPRLTETLIFPSGAASSKALKFRGVISDTWKKVYNYGGRVQLWFTSSSAGWISKDFAPDGSLDLDVESNVQAGYVEFTYRIVWKDGHVQWLGSERSNGSIVFSSSIVPTSGWKVWAATADGITEGQGTEENRVLVPDPDFKPHRVYMPDPILVGNWNEETKDGVRVISSAGSDSVLVLPSPETTLTTTTTTTWYDPSKKTLAKEVEKTGSVFVQAKVEEHVGVAVFKPSGWTRVEKPNPTAPVETPAPAAVEEKEEPKEDVQVELVPPVIAAEPELSVPANEPEPPSSAVEPEPTHTVSRRPSALQLQTITRDHGSMLGFVRYIFTFAGLYLATLLTLLFGVRPIQRRDFQERDKQREVENDEWEDGIQQVEIVEKEDETIEVKPVEIDQEHEAEEEDDKSSVASSTVAETESFTILLPASEKSSSLVYAFYPPTPTAKLILHSEEGRELEPVALGESLFEVHDASGIITFSL